MPKKTKSIIKESILVEAQLLINIDIDLLDNITDLTSLKNIKNNIIKQLHTDLSLDPSLDPISYNIKIISNNSKSLDVKSEDFIKKD